MFKVFTTIYGCKTVLHVTCHVNVNVLSSGLGMGRWVNSGALVILYGHSVLIGHLKGTRVAAVVSDSEY